MCLVMNSCYIRARHVTLCPAGFASTHCCAALLFTEKISFDQITDCDSMRLALISRIFLMPKSQAQMQLDKLAACHQRTSLQALFACALKPASCSTTLCSCTVSLLSEYPWIICAEILCWEQNTIPKQHQLYSATVHYACSLKQTWTHIHKSKLSTCDQALTWQWRCSLTEYSTVAQGLNKNGHVAIAYVSAWTLYVWRKWV